jgi:hypothetical protein
MKAGRFQMWIGPTQGKMRRPKVWAFKVSGLKLKYQQAWPGLHQQAWPRLHQQAWPRLHLLVGLHRPLHVTWVNTKYPLNPSENKYPAYFPPNFCLQNISQTPRPPELCTRCCTVGSPSVHACVYEGNLRTCLSNNQLLEFFNLPFWKCKNITWIFQEIPPFPSPKIGVS